MEIKFLKPDVTFITSMQEVVKEEVENGNILLRTDDEMANTIRSYIVVEVDGEMAGFTALYIHSQRLAEVARDMGAVAGRMQREFLQPLVNRIVFLYTEMGLLDLPRIDGRQIRVVPASPLLRAQDFQDISDFSRFNETIMGSFGQQMSMLLMNRERTVKWLASKFGIDEDLLNTPEEYK